MSEPLFSTTYCPTCGKVVPAPERESLLTALTTLLGAVRETIEAAQEPKGTPEQKLTTFAVLMERAINRLAAAEQAARKAIND